MHYVCHKLHSRRPGACRRFSPEHRLRSALEAPFTRLTSVMEHVPSLPDGTRYVTLRRTNLPITLEELSEGFAWRSTMRVMERLFLCVATLSAVLLCVQVGSASSIGQNNLLDADQQNMTTPTTSPVNASPLCPGKQDLLHVEASDEARKALVGWLAKDTARLIFIYFDLVVGNLTYHPGSCPDDGMSAIDAQTPLAWVLTSGGPDGGPGAQESHSFAHAYLTLPVSYPRIYSMGILEGHYIATLRHEVYRMKVVVDNSTSVDAESCWKSLNKTVKSSLMFDVVESFVSKLDVGLTWQNTSSWKMCYSDPTGEDLPFSSSPLIPHTPAYICRDHDKRGSMKRLERDPFLKGLFVLFLFLAVGMLALQCFGLSRLLTFVKQWGEEDDNERFFTFRGNVFPRAGLFSTSRLPDHVTVGAVLSSDGVLGQRAFVRLKWIVFLGSCCFLFAVWPNVFVQTILIPTSPVGKLGVSSAETFGRNLLCQPNIPTGLSLSYISAGFYCVFGPLSFLLCTVMLMFTWCLASAWNESNRLEEAAKLSETLNEYSGALSHLITSLYLSILGYLRAFCQFPWSAAFKIVGDRRQDGGQPQDGEEQEENCCKTLLSFLIAQILFWSVWLICMFFLVSLSIVGELFRISGIPVFCTMLASKVTGTFCADTVKCCSLTSRIFIALSVVLLFIQGSELLMFAILSSVSLYITFPLQTFLIVSWSVALVAETQNLLQDYRSPLLAVHEKTLDIIKTLVGEKITYAVGKKDKSILTSRLCLRSAPGETEEDIYWKKFFEESELLQDQVCLRLLTGGGDDQEFQIDYEPSSFPFFNDDFDDVEEEKPQSDEPYITSLMNWLDVRPENTSYKAVIRQKLQKALWSRVSLKLTKLLFLVVFFLAILLLLLAFNSLWKDPNPKDTNSLLLTIVMVPLYTFFRTKLSSSSLTDEDKILMHKLLDDGLREIFSKVGVSRQQLYFLTTFLEVGTCSASVSHPGMWYKACFFHVSAPESALH